LAQPAKNKNMEDKKYIIIIAAIITVISLLLLSIIGMLYYQRIQSQQSQIPAPPIANNQNPGNNQGGLPTTPNILPAQQKQELQKEKQFISAFYQPINFEKTANSPQYSLPITNIKDTIVNYRDFSRKIDIENNLEKLSNQGFLIIPNPVSDNADWETSFRLAQAQDLPIFISADAIAGIYQTTLNVTYKEIEAEAFYSSLWQFLRSLYDTSKERYQSRYQQLGIESDPTVEGNRLELAYITTALKLLEPKPNQTRETITADKKFFSTQEALSYSVIIPDYLKDQVEQELKNINSRSANARSPLFLKDTNYSAYAIPAEYQGSERLKNYYLATTWLSQNLFPLWHKGNDCPDCTYDEADHAIMFMASLYLSHDINANQELKNRWANIYKTIGFFKGLEVNTTYLDYAAALNHALGENYNVYSLFDLQGDELKSKISQLQKIIDDTEYFESLAGQSNAKQLDGLRLLRQRFVLDQSVFNKLYGDPTGKYTETVSKENPLPFTACQKNQQEVVRCVPTALDFFSILGNQTTKNILNESKNNRFEKYQNVHDQFASALNQYDQSLWRDNSYLSLLDALKQIPAHTESGMPTFMSTPAWDAKTLQTNLGAWTDFHRTLVIEKVSPDTSSNLKPYFPYGYIEPQPAFYAKLLASVEMMKNGLTALQVISPQEKSYQRLNDLSSILRQALDISQKELAGKKLEVYDFNFINNFHSEIKRITGDIKKENTKNVFTINRIFGEQTLAQTINGFSYAVIIYPEADGRLFLATGPVYNYSEKNRNQNFFPDWQSIMKP
jgi:hypothetical protein